MNKIIKSVIKQNQIKNNFLTFEQFMQNPDLVNKVKQMSQQMNVQFQQTSDQTKEDLDKQLTVDQKDKLKFISSYMKNLSNDEKQYLNLKLKESIQAKTGFNITDINPNAPDFQILQKNPFGIINNTWQNEAIDFQKGPVSSSSSQKSGGAQQQQEQEVQQEKVEKTNFDLELSAVDPASKIKAIKEVRTLFGLGLKEAKDLVEKAPTVLKNNMPKAEAEEMAEKLKAVGCTLNLI